MVKLIRSGVLILACFLGGSSFAQFRDLLDTVEGEAIALSGNRIVLMTEGGGVHEVTLTGLAVPPPGTRCPLDDGTDGTWDCAEGSRRALASFMEGKEVECDVTLPVFDGSDPIVAICMIPLSFDHETKTFNSKPEDRFINDWMLYTGWAKLLPEWKDRMPPLYRAELYARTIGAVLWSSKGWFPDEP